MDLLAFIMALKAQGMTAAKITEAVTEYLEDHPDALDQAAVEAILDGRLDVIDNELSSVKSAVSNIETVIEGLDGGISATARTLLITILSAAVYTSDQSDNIEALEAALDDDSDVTITQSGTTLIFGNVPAITSITQSETTLVCA